MRPFERHRRTRLAPVTALVIAVGGLSATALTSGGASAAAEQDPIFTLVTPVSTQAVDRYKGEDIYLYDLGIYAIAPKGLEIRTQRGSRYTDPITSTLTVGEGSTKTTVELPAALSTKVDTLDKFYSLRVTNSAGKVVKKTTASFCLNSESAARATPTGAAKNPYPYVCGEHPFSKGSVLGIARGWSVPVLGDWRNPTSFKGKDGTYTLRVSISSGWRTALGLKASESVSEIKLKVKTYTDPGGAAASSQSSTTTTHHHLSAMATGQKLSPQHAAMEAARIRSYGKAATPAAGAPSTTLRTSAVTDDLPKPDLRSLPAFQIALGRYDAEGRPTKKTYLNFGATVWNAGSSPLVVDGYRQPGKDLMDAYQYFYDTQGNEVGSTPAGTLEWDPRTGHEHWHFTAFATYRLLDSTQKITKRSGKEAFCLVPTDPVDLTFPQAQWRPFSTDLSTACGSKQALSIREVLDPGWGDTYGQYLPGQSFNVTNLPNGIYYVEVLANPDLKLAESNTTNNRSLRKVKLGGTPGGKRTLKVYAYQGITK